MRLARQGLSPKSFGAAQTGLTISLLDGWIAGLYHHAQIPKTFCWWGGGPCGPVWPQTCYAKVSLPLRLEIIGLRHYTQIYVVWELNPGIYVCYATSY